MTDKTQKENISPPEEFYKIINDFISDMLITFPEYSGIIAKWWNRPSADKEKELLFVFKHCVKVFPERFFNILYKDVEMFSPDSEINTEFLPGIVFKQLWSCDISDNTRVTIWKYLQLILFSVIGSVHSSSELGDTAKLFEAINEDELKTKLQETLENMHNMFDISANETNTETPNIPNAQDLHEHITSMMGGKLGKLAMELAEDTAKDLNLDMDNNSDAKDVFQKLFKNPTKLMSMVKNVGSKIDEKIKSGEIKESELMEEGMGLLNKMKDMPGMENMQKMFSQMGIPGLGNNAKLNMGAMEAQLNKNMKHAQMKERMRSKAAANAKAKEEQSKTAFCNMSDSPTYSEEELIKIFSTGEKVEKTPRGSKPPLPPKKKKGKK
jgi:hypothetical protein